MAAASGGPAIVAKVTMPQLGESVAEGTIGKWLKQPGDHVAKYEPLVEVITDKVNAEVPSPFEGVLREILVEEGATVPNNAEIAVIETADDGATASPEPAAATAAPAPSGAERPAEPAGGPAGSDETSPPSTPAPAGQPAATPVAATATAAEANGAASSRASAASSNPVPVTTATAPANGDPDARMTPAVRRLLREHGLGPEQIVGTGGGGRITRDDVLAVVETIRTGGQPPAPASAPQPAAQPQAPPQPQAAPPRSQPPAPAASPAAAPPPAPPPRPARP